MASARNTQDSKVKTLDKYLAALDLRKGGMSYPKIAARLGWKGPSGAHHAVGMALKHVYQEAAEPLVKIEMERLDSQFKIAWDIAHDEAQPAAIRLASLDRMVRIMERRAKLLGLDQPVRTTVDQVSKVLVEYVDGASAEADAAASEDS